MKRPVRVVLVLIALILMAAPSSVVVTLVLFPFWSWLEASFGIESVGHAGPAAWCYLAVFLVFVGSAVLGVIAHSARRRAVGPPER